MLPEVVDLAVIRDPSFSIATRHGLVTGLAEVDDGEPSVAEAYFRVRIKPDSLVVGAAMRQRIGHRANGVTRRPFGAPQNAAESAHSILASPAQEGNEPESGARSSP